MAGALPAAAQGPDAVRTGVPLVIDHFFDIVAVVTLLCLCAAVGQLILRWTGVHREDAVERLALAVGLGAGLLSTLMLVLGLTGLLRPAPIAGLLATLAWLARHEIRALPERLRDAMGGVRAVVEGPAGAGAAVIFALVAIFMVVQALAPVTDWDALMYHLRLPAQFVERGAVFLPEDNLHVSRVGLIHLLYVPLLLVGADSGPALLSVGLALLLAVTLASCCHRYLTQRTGTACLALLWGSSLLILVAITPRVDVSLAFYLFLVHALLVGLVVEGYDRVAFLLAAVLLGFAFGVKYQGAVYGLALLPLIVRVSWLEVNRAWTARGLLAFGALGFVAALPWLVKNVVLIGSPFYPFLAERLAQPWLSAFFPGGPPPMIQARELYDWMWELRRTFNLRDFFFAAERLTIEGEGIFYRGNPILLLLPLWALFFRERVLNWLLAPALAYVAILLIVSPRTNLRYLAPALIPLTIVAVHVVLETTSRAPARLGRILVIVLFGVALLPSAEAMAYWTFRGRAPEHAVGFASEREYLEGHFIFEVVARSRMVQYVNRELPSDSRVLMLFEARGYGIEREVVQDNKGTNWPFLAGRLEDGMCLEAGGFSHVLANESALAYYQVGGLDLDIVHWPAFARFAERCLVEVHRVEGMILYEVVDSTGSWRSARNVAP